MANGAVVAVAGIACAAALVIGLIAMTTNSDRGRRRVISGDGRGGDAALAAADDALRTAYSGVIAKPGKGVAHARLVAAALRDAGCDEPVQIAGLLHDVVENTGWTLEDVRNRFGTPVAELVGALTEDDTIRRYRPRKRALRKRIAGGGPDAIDIALADKIASLRYMLDNARRVRARKREHYTALLASTRDAARHPTLAAQVGDLLADLAASESRTTGDAP